MIITQLTGGLGNQMFQYAFGRTLAERHNTELKLDLTFYSDKKRNSAYNAIRGYDLPIFNIRESIASEAEIWHFAKRVRIDIGDRILNRLLGVKKGHIREPHFHFSEWANSSPDNSYLSGYWQSEKYFSSSVETLRSEFSFREPFAPAALSVADKIGGSESVCVHVRRGDFVTNPFNGLCGRDYYENGAKIIQDKYPDVKFFVFSDDLGWCKQNLNFSAETTFVDGDFGPLKFREDLWLMSNCKHFVIANSSFAWWAVWLNGRNDNLVIAPKAWFQDRSFDTADLVPSRWIRL